MKITKILLTMLIFVATGITQVINKTPKRVTVKKEYIGAQQFLEDSFKLAQLVFNSGFKPTFLIALWRGGSQVGIATEEYFTYKNTPIKNHLAVRVSAYSHDQINKTVQVFNLDYVVKTLTKSDRLLIIDDVVDTGTSVQALIKKIKTLCGSNTPQTIKIASVYYKPKKASFTPDFYLHQTDRWLVFPHELEGLTTEEITEFKGKEIIDTLQKKE